MRAGAIAFALAIATVPATSAAQVSSQHPPRAGSPQRQAIIDAIRPAVETQLGPDIIFMARCVQVWNGWALVAAEPRRRGGRKIDATILADWDNRDGLDVTALLRFRYGRWNLVDHAIGATDFWYDGIAPRPLMRSRCY